MLRSRAERRVRQERGGAARCAGKEKASTAQSKRGAERQSRHGLDASEHRHRRCPSRRVGRAMLTPPLLASPLRAAITAATRPPEPELVPGLLEQARLRRPTSARRHALALRVARGCASAGRGGRAGLVQGLLQEFALSSQRGRRADVPGRGAAAHSRRRHARRADPRQDRERRVAARTSARARRCSSTPRPGACCSPASWWRRTARAASARRCRRVVGRGGEPLIRKGVDMAMRMMGEQFVTGETIERGARQRAAARGARASATPTTCWARRR